MDGLACGGQVWFQSTSHNNSVEKLSGKAVLIRVTNLKVFAWLNRTAI